jgi:kynurenine 3-monooxygenase
MIHHPDGRYVVIARNFGVPSHVSSPSSAIRQESQLYDPSTNQCINSLPRPLLNLRLIQALPTDSDRMKLRFETKLDRIDWRRNIAYAKSKKGGKPGEEREQGQDEPSHESKEDKVEVAFDLIVGCDGSWSKVRQEMMKVERYVSSDTCRTLV